MIHSILLIVTLLICGHDACVTPNAKNYCRNVPPNTDALCYAHENPDPKMDTECSKCCKEDCCFTSAGTLEEYGEMSHRYCGDVKPWRSDSLLAVLNGDDEIGCQCKEIENVLNININHAFQNDEIGKMVELLMKLCITFHNFCLNSRNLN